MRASPIVNCGVWNRAAMSLPDGERWMRLALEEAQRCLRSDGPSDVPVGAICVRNERIIGRGHNSRELTKDPTAHAEVLAIRAAAAQIGTWRLERVTLYVTLEPCPMCAGAIWLSRFSRLVYGARESKSGACGSVWDVVRDPRLTWKPQVRGGVMAEESASLLAAFFAARRREP